MKATTVNDIVKFSQTENLPSVRAEEQIFRDASALIERWHRAHNETGGPGRSHYEYLVAVIDELTPAAEKVCARLAKLSKPATKIEIANHLALLLKSFPNAGKDNAEFFGRMLAEDVGAQQPTRGGIEAACRALRQGCRFIPTISETLEALVKAEGAQRLQVRILAELPQQRQKLTGYIAYEKGKQEECERERACRALAIAHENDPDIDLPF
jgi:hypothetical protein